MTEIDYENLAKAAWDSYTGYVSRVPWENAGPYRKQGSSVQVRAVVAALRDQGLVVARRDDLRLLSDGYKGNAIAAYECCGPMVGDDWRKAVDGDDEEAIDRIDAALAAPPSSGKEVST